MTSIQWHFPQLLMGLEMPKYRARGSSSSANPVGPLFCGKFVAMAVGIDYDGAAIGIVNSGRATPLLTSRWWVGRSVGPLVREFFKTFEGKMPIR